MPSIPDDFRFEVGVSRKKEFQFTLSFFGSANSYFADLYLVKIEIPDIGWIH